ncbi:MAG: ATP-binding protein [Clostridium sp.]
MSIIDNLYKINRFWKSGKVNKSLLYNVVREEFTQITDNIDEKRILSIIGPRRVGKSTLLYQTIDHLLKSGVNPKKILMFSGDDPSLFTDKNTIMDILEAYSTEVLHETLEDLEDRIYVFIDEIHMIKGWQLHLKSYYDRRYNIKFIISGSSSTHLFKDSNESLLGRIEDLYILPLSLNQFIKFYSIYNVTDFKLNNFIDLLPKINLYDKAEEYYDILRKNIYNLNEFKPIINKIISEYLLVGGYPEYFECNNILKWQKRLVDDIVGRGLYRDIVSIYNIKNPDALEKLMYFIASNSGQEFSYTTIAQTLGVDINTVSSYVTYLSQAFLIGVSNNYTGNVGKSIRKNKKLYILDNGIRNALMRVDDLDPTDIGMLIENECLRHAKSYSDINNYTVYFWRDNGKEVDVVIDKKNNLLPIEIKYRTEIKGNQLKGLDKFCKDYDVINRVVITKDLLDTKENTIYIPFWLM